MKDLIQCTTSHRNFQRWLNVGTYPITFLDRDDNPVCPLIQLENSKGVTYLYHVALRDGSITWDYAPHFIGAYNRTNGALYLTRDFLCSSECARAELVDIAAQNNPTVKDEINAKVNQYVEAAIGREIKNHSVTELASGYFSRVYKEELEDRAAYKARKLFFEGREPDWQFQPDYAMKKLKESTFLAYLRGPEQFVQQAAERYIAFERFSFLSDFYKNEVLKAKYHALVQDTTDPIHRMKAIADAVKSSGAKTVIVTIQKDDQEFTFEMMADSLAEIRSWYTSLDMAFVDRIEFSRLFGGSTYFLANEITKITYGRNTIYEAPDAQSEEMTEGFGQGPAPDGMEMTQ